MMTSFGSRAPHRAKRFHRAGRFRIRWLEQLRPLPSREEISRVLGSHRVRFQLQSNGTLITEEWIRFLSSDLRLELCLSIDGPAWMHDANRRTRQGAGSHARTMAGVTRLKAAGLSFDCISVITDLALEHPEQLYDFFVELRPRALALNPEEQDGIHATSSLGTGSSEARYRRFLRRFADLWQRDRPFSIRELNRLERARSDRGFDPIRVNHQTEPWRLVTVGSGGELHTFSPELLGLDISEVGPWLGNVHSDSVDSIESSARFRWLHGQIHQGVEQCRARCNYFQVCGGGAPSNKWGEHGSFAVAETAHCRLAVQATIDALSEVVR